MSLIDWTTVTVRATWSTNVFNERQASARWMGAELEVRVNLTEVPEEERPDTLADVHARLTELCQDLTEDAATRFVQEKGGEGWQK